jgi:D-alanyl-D-alanine carboxypeptidase
MPMNRYVRVSQRAAQTSPTEVGLRAGEEYRIQDLLKACLIRSANDAAVTLAEATAGSEWEFAQLMNQKARQLGLHDSRFRNATGLPDPEDQYTTSSDMARIMKAAHQNSYINQLLKTRAAVIRSRQGRKVYFESRNRLINYKHPVYGKTGFTRAARHCFVGEALIGSRRVVVSMLGSRALWKDLKSILYFLAGNSPSQRYGQIVSDREIARIQGALRKSGDYAGSLTGRYDSKTVKAVKKFQKRKGLKADGVVGPRTLAKLKPYL